MADFYRNFEDPVIRILMIAVFLSGGIAISMYFSGESSDRGNHRYRRGHLLATGVATGSCGCKQKFDVLNQVNDDTLVSYPQR
ncbi:MAG: hypothetical protein ACLU4N_27930 [Butyricimonas faecihominis]